MKKLLIIIFGMLSSMYSIAQTSVTAIKNGYEHTDNVLIKEINYPETITIAYSNDIGGTMLSYNTTTHVSKNMIIPGCIVRDFVIDNDTVFFCGQLSGYGGCIGFFNINDFFFGTGLFSLYYLWELYDNKTVEDLTKLVTYTRANLEDEHYRHIVSIGYEKDDTLGCVVDALLDGYGYVIGNTGYVNHSGVECFRDIALVGDHLVTAGFENGLYMTMRLYDRTNALYSGLQDKRYTFDNFNLCEDVMREWVTKDNLITPITDNLFATASVEYDKTNGIQTKHHHRIMVAKFKKNLFEGNYNVEMTWSSEVVYPNHSTISNLNGFVYSTTHNTFGLLSHSAKDRSLFLEMNSTVDSALNSLDAYFGANTCLDKGLQGLDLYDNGDRYVMSGRCSNDRRTQTYLVETSRHQSLCLPFEDVEIYPFCLIKPHTAYVPFASFASIPHSRTEIAKDYSYFDINIECEAGEK